MSAPVFRSKWLDFTTPAEGASVSSVSAPLARPEEATPSDSSGRRGLELANRPLVSRTSVGAKTCRYPTDRTDKSAATGGGPLMERTTPAVCGWCDGVLAPYLLDLPGRGPALLCPTCKRWTVIGGTA